MANANLIAAAPDLLELCEKSLAYLTADDDPSPLEIEIYHSDLEEAIKKAKGL